MYKRGHIHFIGIGGIGMSGIAKILKHQGYQISGCDIDVEQSSIQDLLKMGCSIFKGNNTAQCNDKSIDVLVYSSAIKTDNPEIKFAQKRDIPTIPRALMLAELMRTKYSIAITGAHGKTTTTSMISHLLIEADKDPTIIIGGHLQNLSSNARWGNGDFLVAEADESDRSISRLYPTLAIVTNIDHEHLDVYKSLDEIKKTFSEFLANIPFYGKAFVCIDDPHLASILPLTHIKTIKYGLNSHLADISAQNISIEEDHSKFDVFLKKTNLGTLQINMPGRHNIYNALAAMAVALDLDIDFKIIKKAFQSFKGIERRFSFQGTFQGAKLFDDYGHHPTEIYNTLLVARKKAHKKLIVVFQPQRFTRTEKLWQEFINLFAYSPIDHLIITDIYPANELPIESVTSKNLVEALKSKQPACNVSYVPYENTLESIKTVIKSVTSEDDLLLTLGAGKVNKLSEILNP